jgi:hypothetical protein
VSAFRSEQAFHFMTQLSGGDVVLVDYYNLNNSGFGALYRLPIQLPPGQPLFHSAFSDENPEIQQTLGQGSLSPFRMPFTRRGMRSITPFTHSADEAAPLGKDGKRVGKFTHPSAAPGGDLLVVWTPGPANDLERPTPIPYYDSGIYVLPKGEEIWSPHSLRLIKNDPAWNEAWPRALVPYRAIHGVDEPDEIPVLPNNGTLDSRLPAGTPYGLVGTSSFYKRESFPGRASTWSNTFDGLDAFNTSENGQSSNWGYQGADAGKYTNADIWAVRLLAMEPNTHRSYGPNAGRRFSSHAAERLRILGEIPLRKWDASGRPILDSEGNPDTSFLAKVVADTPFTFQTLDRNGMVLNMSQTWHQLRPGEVRADCGGCHAHSQQPLAFESTRAADSDHEVYDLSVVTPLVTLGAASADPGLELVSSGVVNVEFHRDIRPLLARSCVASCHTQSNPEPAGNLVLDDTALYDGLPGDYARLAADSVARWGYPPVIVNRTWRQTNASRYVRMFQSRRSLLVWKIFGERLDGWSNADHPTEIVPGDASTLPKGADPNTADLDYTGSIMPPPESGVPPLTDDEKLRFVRWIDLGCPIDLDGARSEGEGYGWYLDDLRPTLTVSSPRPGRNESSIDEIRFGIADAYTGIDPSSLSVTADFPVAGRKAGAQLADLAKHQGGRVYTIPLASPLPPMRSAHVTIEVADRQGNRTRVVRRFTTATASSASQGVESALRP